TVLEGTTHEVFAAVRGVLEEHARERPVIVAFDDVHWAEPTFLDFVEYLGGRLGDARILVLSLARPQLVQQRPGWVQEPWASIALRPLSVADSADLLDALGTPVALQAPITEAAEGNPLFVEQLAAMVGDDGAAREMPGSVRGVLHARLDRLVRE